MNEVVCRRSHKWQSRNPVLFSAFILQSFHALCIRLALGQALEEKGKSRYLLHNVVGEAHGVMATQEGPSTPNWGGYEGGALLSGEVSQGR